MTIERDDCGWRACCSALEEYEAVTGGETKEEAIAHIESALAMILTDMKAVGARPPPDVTIPGGILLTIEAG